MVAIVTVAANPTSGTCTSTPCEWVDAQANVSGMRPPYTVVFNWGDGTSTTVQSSSDMISAKHEYTQCGTYAITATVTDSTGAQASATLYPYYVCIPTQTASGQTTYVQPSTSTKQPTPCPAPGACNTGGGSSVCWRSGPGVFTLCAPGAKSFGIVYDRTKPPGVGNGVTFTDIATIQSRYVWPSYFLLLYPYVVKSWSVKTAGLSASVTRPSGLPGLNPDYTLLVYTYCSGNECGASEQAVEIDVSMDYSSPEQQYSGGGPVLGTTTTPTGQTVYTAPVTESPETEKAQQATLAYEWTPDILIGLGILALVGGIAYVARKHH